MRSQPIRQGTLWGISYEVWPACVSCSGMIDGHLTRRQYVGYGVRDAVRAFAAEVMRARFAL